MFQEGVTMLSVGGAVRSGGMQLPVRGVWTAAFHRKSPPPGHALSGPPWARIPAACCPKSSLRRLSGAESLWGARRLSGAESLWGARRLSGAESLWGARRLSGAESLWGARRLSGAESLWGARRLSGAESLWGARRLSGGAGWSGGLSASAPVHLCEHFLVSVQQVSGLPWWLSIVVATLAVRTLITLPLATYQMVVIARVSEGGGLQERRVFSCVVVLYISSLEVSSVIERQCC